MTPASPIVSLAATGSDGGGTPSPSGGLHKAAQEFEGMLINTLWSSFRDDPMLKDDDEEDAGGENMRALGTQAMSTALAKQGGLGMAKMIESRLGARIEGPEGGGASPSAAVRAYTQKKD